MHIEINTTEPDGPITLPGTIPGLLRRCSPVVHETIDHEDWDDSDDPPLVKVRAVLGLLRYGGAVASVSYEQSGVPLQEDEVPVSKLSLDLEDQTGRLHAAWWCGATEKRQPDTTSVVPNGYVVDADSDGLRVAIFHKCVAYGYTSDEVPALAELDPHDNRKISDGSRRADALALQAVCLHVGGGR